MIALDLSLQMFLKGKDVRALPSKVVLSYTLSSLKRSKKVSMPPIKVHCGEWWSSTSILQFLKNFRKLRSWQQDLWPTKCELKWLKHVVLCGSTARELRRISINRRNLANATLGEDYSASFDMEIGNPSDMKRDCPWPTSSNPRHMPADLKVARWPCSGSLNLRKANIYYLSEIDSSYSGAGYNWIQISALLQISSYNLGMSCYLPHDWNHTVDNVLPPL